MDIHYSAFLANELYGVELSEDKFEELALIAYNFIGNKNCKLYRYFAVINPLTLLYNIFYLQLQAIIAIKRNFSRSLCGNIIIYFC